MSGHRSVYVGAIFVGVMVLCDPARASNGLRPRTPPVFPVEPCSTVVDRSVDPILRVEVNLPNEDVELSADELPDSRTLRFFLACRAPGLDETLPNWITRDDAERAMQAGIIEAMPDAEDVAETSAAWPVGAQAQGCLFPLTRNAPLPMSCDAVNGGLVGDTSELPAGVYELWGYTFEPPVNLWTRAQHLVVIHDGNGSLPGAIVTEIVPADDGWPPTYTTRGCSASEAELALHWIDATSAEVFDPEAWSSLARTPVGPGPFELEVTPPTEALEKGILIRYDAARDTAQWEAYVQVPLVTLQGADGIVRAAPDGVCEPARTAGADDASADSEGTGCSLATPGGFERFLWVPVIVGGLARLRRRYHRC